MSTLQPPVSASDHLRGEGPVTLVHFGDFECPFSGEVHRLLVRLREAGLAFRQGFRHFPIERLHPHALAAACAAEAAGAQGRFWAMHDRLYAHRRALRDDDLHAHGEALGLDPDRFELDRLAAATREHVRRDRRHALRSGVDTTFNLFIDGTRYTSPMKAPEVRAAVEALRPPPSDEGGR